MFFPKRDEELETHNQTAYFSALVKALYLSCSWFPKAQRKGKCRSKLYLNGNREMVSKCASEPLLSVDCSHIFYTHKEKLLFLLIRFRPPLIGQRRQLAERVVPDTRSSATPCLLSIQPRWRHCMVEFARRVVCTRSYSLTGR